MLDALLSLLELLLLELPLLSELMLLSELLVDCPACPLLEFEFNDVVLLPPPPPGCVELCPGAVLLLLMPELLPGFTTITIESLDDDTIGGPS